MATGDAAADGIRGILIGGGMLLAGWFGFAPETIAPFVDNMIALVSSAVAVISFISLIVARYKTVSVPVSVVIDSEQDPTVPTIPTVNPITGMIRSAPIGPT